MILSVMVLEAHYEINLLLCVLNHLIETPTLGVEEWQLLECLDRSALVRYLQHDERVFEWRLELSEQHHHLALEGPAVVVIVIALVISITTIISDRMA